MSCIPDFDENERKPIMVVVATGQFQSEPVALTGLSGAEMLIPDVFFPPVAFINLLAEGNSVALVRYPAEPCHMVKLPMAAFEEKPIYLQLLSASLAPSTQVFERSFIILPEVNQVVLEADQPIQPVSKKRPSNVGKREADIFFDDRKDI